MEELGRIEEIVFDSIARTIYHGGIEYAEQKMEEFAKEAQKYIDESVKPELKQAYTAYLDYVIQRKL